MVQRMWIECECGWEGLSTECELDEWGWLWCPACGEGQFERIVESSSR